MGMNELKRTERVRSELLIEVLFSRKARSFLQHPFRLSFVLVEKQDSRCSVLFLSSKKKMKLAVDRNRRKRLLRELYRLNKGPLLQFLEIQNLRIALALNYLGAEELGFHLHQPQFQKAIQKLILEIKKAHSIPLPPAH